MTTQRTIGVMTGNSMDAADAVLLDFTTTPPTLLATAQEPIPPALATTLRQLADSNTINPEILLTAQNALTDICAAAVAKLNAAPDSVAAIGCHGQTIAHRPATAATWQLLNGARLAEQTQLDVICDFRARDIASGGEGAPFAPFFHRHYFAAHAPCDIINIGGIANLTRLSADGDITAAYDTGPGMLLMDAWCRQHNKGDYDRDGQFAAEGKTNDTLLQTLLTHPYLTRRPPKSCGREEFSLTLLPPNAHRLPPADVQATLLDYTARTIAAAAQNTAIFLCGGGSQNRALVARLTALLPAPPKTSDAAGLPPQWVEAAAFAYLAKCHLDGTPLPAAAVTGGQTRIAGAHYPR